MNISATNSTPASFGNADGVRKEVSLDDVTRVSQQLKDTWCPNCEDDAKSGSKKKSKLGVLISVGTAVAASFVGGRLLAKKAFTAFPSLPTKIKDVIKKGADFIKNKGDDLATKDNKFLGKLGTGLGKLVSGAKSLYTKFAKGKPFEDVLTSAVGLASVATIGKDVVTVDGNGDGTADIAQTKVNAYKNALKTVDVISETAHMVS